MAFILKAFLVLTNDTATSNDMDLRILAKYYHPLPHEWDSVSKQKSFEKSLLSKIKKQSADILLLDNNMTMVYRNQSDVIVILIFPSEENELVMSNVLDCFTECIQECLRGQVDRKTILDNYDILTVIVDEMIDQGIVMEIDSMELLSRIPRRQIDGPDTPTLSEPSLSGAFQTAKFIKDQILKG